jgi:hypothetical protein
MVYFEKSQPAPNIRSTHNSQEILDRLKSDFHNKCYICEEKKPQNINIEHFVSHKGNKDLKLDWNNLFLSCRHCNDIKSTKYDNLLNCTILSDCVDTALHYCCMPMPKEKPIFKVLIPSDKAELTKELLEKCFNGEHTAQKVLESSNLRSSLLKELRLFQNLLFDYYENEDNEYFLIKIKEHLSNRSAFTAFKRWIIRDNPTLNQQFKQHIKD